jgi:hypothetical protein
MSLTIAAVADHWSFLARFGAFTRAMAFLATVEAATRGSATSFTRLSAFTGAVTVLTAVKATSRLTRFWTIAGEVAVLAAVGLNVLHFRPWSSKTAAIERIGTQRARSSGFAFFGW